MWAYPQPFRIVWHFQRMDTAPWAALSLGAPAPEHCANPVLRTDVEESATMAPADEVPVLRLRGGKGGFGSMLRSQGGRMASKQSTNYEACRDLNGRRLKLTTDAKAYVARVSRACACRPAGLTLRVAGSQAERLEGDAGATAGGKGGQAQEQDSGVPGRGARAGRAQAAARARGSCPGRADGGAGRCCRVGRGRRC
jgi:hypothetical protein